MTETLNEYCKRTEQEKRELSAKIAQMECSTFGMEKVIAEHVKERNGWEYERGNLIHKIQERDLLIQHHDYVMSENRKTMEAWFNEIERLKTMNRELKENEKYQQDIYLMFRDRVKELEQENTAQKFTIDAQAAAIKEWEQMGKITISFPGSSKKSCDTCKGQPEDGTRYKISCLYCENYSKWEPIPTHKG